MRVHQGESVEDVKNRMTDDQLEYLSEVVLKKEMLEIAKDEYPASVAYAMDVVGIPAVVLGMELDLGRARVYQVREVGRKILSESEGE